MVTSFGIADLLGQSGQLADPIALLVFTSQCCKRWLGNWGLNQLVGFILEGFGLLIQTSAWLDFFSATGCIGCDAGLNVFMQLNG